jgi:invasion protein IalB
MRIRTILAMGFLVLSASTGLTEVRAPVATPDSTTETFGDWTVACSTVPSTKERACEVGITIAVRGQTAPVARIGIGQQLKDKAMRMVALVPANVLIAPGVGIATDGGKVVLSLPFKSCMPGGCFAETNLGKDQIQTLRQNSKPGQILFSDPAGKQVALDLPFNGLDQALDALAKR